MNRKKLNVRFHVVVMLVLVLATAVVYLQVKDYDFVNFDDNEYVTENRYVQSGLTSGNITWAFTTFHVSNWHPLTWISHILDCQLFGLNPGPHHLVNLLFHTANAILLFLVLHRMTKTLWQSAFVAAIFAIHPLHVESVAWISERKDVLSTFFWMLTMGAYVFYVEKQELKRYLPVLFFLVLGLMAKPMLVTLPFVLLLLDYWPLRRLQGEIPSVSTKKKEAILVLRSKKRERREKTIKMERTNTRKTITKQQPLTVHIILEKVPLFVLSLASCIITYMAQQKGGAIRSLQVFSLPVRIANALVSYCAYIWKTIWPSGLAVFYPHPGMPPVWMVLGAFLFIVISTFLIVRGKERYPYLATGWLWYLGTLVPVAGLVQVGVQGMADRYTYVPLIGVSIMIAWVVPDILNKWCYRNFVLSLLALIILSILSVAAYNQVRYWKNSIALFTRTVAVTVDNSVMQNNLGDALEDEGRLDEAIAHYTEALRIDPSLVESYNNRGLALTKLGRPDEAMSDFLEAVRINPRHAAAHYNLGNALASRGKFDDAVHHFRESICIRPDYAKAYNNLGKVLLLQGKIDEAITSYQEALRFKPDYAMARENLRDALAMRNKKR